MRRRGSLCILFMVCLFVISAAGQSRLEATRARERADSLLALMSLEEKVGQMTQISIEYLSKGYPAVEEPLTWDMDRLREALTGYHIGSILNVGTSAHTVEHWQRLIRAMQEVAVRDTRHGIPVLYGIDAVHGAGYTLGATLFPQAIGMAATWNPHLMRLNGEITAKEVRASGIPWNFSPVLGIGRQPLWPRLWETFGEDVYLASQMAKAYVQGLEGADNRIGDPDRVAACAKHYLGYSFPLSGKDRTPAWIPERMLREYFLPPFQAAIEAGAHTVMVNSSEINGIPVHSSRYFLTTLLRDELGFEGLICSDWADIKNLHKRERVADSPKEAVRQAVMAGIDMSMVPLDYSFYNDLVDLVREGTVPEERIDDAVHRILTLKFKLGLFEQPFPGDGPEIEFASEAAREANLAMAAESITLLKNAGKVLPLDKKIRVLVTGPTANRVSVMNGGWTVTWQGDRDDLYPENIPTVLKAVEQVLGEDRVIYRPGSAVTVAADIDGAVRAAGEADAIIACLGEDPYCETPGNIRDLSLPGVQMDLVKALRKTGKPLILVLIEGRPRLIREISDDADAIVMAYLPGNEGGRAIAGILFGTYNPSGKLPFTYPRYPNDLTLYDHKNSEHYGDYCTYDPEFAFGFGLSYTDFEYSGLTLDKTVVAPGESIGVSVTVKNTGEREGKEVVQLYLRDLYASVTPPVRKLKRFQKISVEPGESKTVLFRLDYSDLHFIGPENRPVAEPGDFDVMVGNLRSGFTLKID